MSRKATDMSENITRPIIGIENRTAQEVFDIMVARIGAPPAPQHIVVVDVDALATRIVTAACELDGPADASGDDTISITTKDLEAVVHRHATAALESSHEA